MFNNSSKQLLIYSIFILSFQIITPKEKTEELVNKKSESTQSKTESPDSSLLANSECSIFFSSPKNFSNFMIAYFCDDLRRLWNLYYRNNVCHAVKAPIKCNLCSALALIPNILLVLLLQRFTEAPIYNCEKYCSRRYEDEELYCNSNLITYSSLPEKDRCLNKTHKRCIDRINYFFNLLKSNTTDKSNLIESFIPIIDNTIGFILYHSPIIFTAIFLTSIGIIFF